MKNKLLIFSLLFFCIAFNASAVKVIIIGGSKDNKYHKIVYDEKQVICNGSGYNTCPVGWTDVRGAKYWHNMGDVMQFINTAIDKGEVQGTANYLEDLNISWQQSDDNGLTVDVEDNGVRYDEPKE
jgi:hypothetical protein